MTILLFITLCATVIFARTRRTKEEEFLKDTYNTTEGMHLRVVTKVGDIDGDIVAIYFDGLPEGATTSTTHPLTVIPDPNWCDRNPDCLEVINDPNSSFYEAEFNWYIAYDEAGQYKVYVHAVDEHGNDDWVMYIINVADKNRPPQL